MSSTFLDSCQARRPDAKWSIWQKILCTEIDGNQPFPVTDEIEAEGDNYAFVIDDTDVVFTIRTEGGLYYQFYIINDGPNQTYQLFEIIPTGPAPVPIAAFGRNFEFTTTNYMRFRNFTVLTNWHTVSVDESDESIFVDVPVASSAGIASDANTFNALFRYEPSIMAVSFYFKDIDSGALFKPWIVIDGVPTLQLTAV